MDLEQLRQFLFVAQRGNITRAAEELNLSQPALSRSIQRLEEEFGRPLLERKTRSVGLTDAGQLLQSRAQQILGLIEDTKSQIADDGETGRLRIGAIPTVAPFLLPSFLRSFSAEFPAASLVIQEDTTDNLTKRCKQGEIDLAVMAAPVPVKYLEVKELFTEELLLVVDRDHPLAQQESVEIQDVEPFPFVLLDEAHCLTESVVSFCRKRTVQPLVVERTSQLTMVQELVALGHGVSMIPAMARRLDRAEDRVYRSLTAPQPTRTIVAVWNPYRFQSRLLLALRTHLETFAAEFSSDFDAL